MLLNQLTKSTTYGPVMVTRVETITETFIPVPLSGVGNTCHGTLTKLSSKYQIYVRKYISKNSYIFLLVGSKYACP